MKTKVRTHLTKYKAQKKEQSSLFSWPFKYPFLLAVLFIISMWIMAIIFKLFNESYLYHSHLIIFPSLFMAYSVLLYHAWIQRLDNSQLKRNKIEFHFLPYVTIIIFLVIAISLYYKLFVLVYVFVVICIATHLTDKQRKGVRQKNNIIYWDVVRNNANFLNHHKYFQNSKLKQQYKKMVFRWYILLSIAISQFIWVFSMTHIVLEELSFPLQILGNTYLLCSIVTLIISLILFFGQKKSAHKFYMTHMKEKGVFHKHKNKILFY